MSAVLYTYLGKECITCNIKFYVCMLVLGQGNGPHENLHVKFIAMHKSTQTDEPDGSSYSIFFRYKTVYHFFAWGNYTHTQFRYIKNNEYIPVTHKSFTLCQSISLN